MSSLLARWKMMMVAVTDVRLHRSDLAVLAAILDRIGKSGDAWPSLSTIADDASVSRGQVIKVIPRLKDFGYLLVDSGNREKSNCYRMGPAPSIPQASTPRRLEEPTRRRPQASEVGAHRASDVGSHRRPELALKATSFIEPEKKPPADAGVRTRERKKAITFKQWEEAVDENGELIPPDHHVFRYIDSVKLPENLAELAWLVFSAKHRTTQKRYADWPRAFRNAIEGNWYRLWFIDESGEYQLTTQGKQADRQHGMGISAQQADPYRLPRLQL